MCFQDVWPENKRNDNELLHMYVNAINLANQSALYRDWTKFLLWIIKHEQISMRNEEDVLDPMQVPVCATFKHGRV